MINESQANNGHHPLSQLQLKPTSHHSQRYLAKHVGDIQRAVVVDVSIVRTTGKNDLPSTTKADHESRPLTYDVVLKIGSQKITVESSVMPRIGQQLDFLVVNHQQIKVLKVLEKKAILNNLNQVQSSINGRAEKAIKLPLSPVNNGTLFDTATQTKTTSAHRQDIIQHALRTHLPKAHDAINASAMTTLLGKLPILNSSVTAAILQLKQSVNQLPQLTDPFALASAVKNSGMLLESKLNQLASGQEKITLKTLSALGLVVNINDQPAKTTDYKLALLTLIAALNSYRNSVNTAANTQSPPLNMDELWKVITKLMAKNDSSNPAMGDKSREILPLLRLLLSLVSRVQGQQLTALNHQQSTNENTHNLLFELPVWIDQKISMLDIRLQWDKPKNGDSSNEQQVWNAKLCFDIEEEGKLVSLITLRGKKCAAVFWAPTAAIEKKINRSLERLHETLTEQGIDVDKLQCRMGSPEGNNHNMVIRNLLDTNI